MIMGVYAVLGLFLILAAKNPAGNVSLIQFTLWSSVAHAAIMTVHALGNSDEHWHLVADIPALFIVAGVLAALMPPAPVRRVSPAGGR
jgi:peptidoglycan/LPS O-acetylase OafA/YrhL